MVFYLFVYISIEHYAEKFCEYSRLVEDQKELSTNAANIIFIYSMHFFS